MTTSPLRALRRHARSAPTAAPLTVLTVLAGLATPAAAALPPTPAISVQQQGRGLELSLEAQNSSDGNVFGDTVVREASGNEPFDVFLQNQFAGDGGAAASGQVAHQSRISTYKIEGQSELEFAYQGGANNAQGTATVLSTVMVAFSVAADAPFALSGRAEASSTDPAAFAQVAVTFSGMRPDGSIFYVSEMVTHLDGEPVDFLHTGEVMGGSTLTLQVQANGVGSAAGAGGGEGIMAFDFSLDFGDEDADGLLDVWETDGIDANGDDIVDIDLPAMGAHPRKKDLFVEIDALSGVPVSQEALDMVIDAFAQAPAAQVDNPDGSAGVTLHVLVDESGLDHTVGDLPPGYLTAVDDINSLKVEHFGTPADREHPDWQDDVRPARLKVYRYAVMCEAIQDESTGPSILGQAEQPGNDMIVAAGQFDLGRSHAPVRSFAGTFMHELGHNLGLQHEGLGGANNKPNYLSCMNYAYAIPYQGTEEAWVLDYSRETLLDLDEANLDETAGLAGPADRLVMYNAAAAGDDPARALVAADAAQVDWNNDGDLAVDVAQDINRIRSTQGPSPDEVHAGATDWPRLWYHLSGHEAFDPGNFVVPAHAAEEISTAIVAEIEATDVVGSPTHATGQPPRTPGELRAQPNPFNPRVTVRFALASARSVTLDVYDLRGRQVRSLLAGERLAAGEHRVTWDGRDGAGRPQASGTYLLRLRAGERVERTKVLLVR